jgi:hypothetical protein
MLNITKLSTIALAGLIASTSLASAGGLLLDPPKKYDIFDDGVGSDPIHLTPIVIDFPDKPLTPVLPDPPVLNFPDKPNHPKDLAIECSVHSPSGFTNDVWFMNVGTGDLESGTTIKWRIPSTDEHGAFLLPRTLESGEQIKISDLLLDDAASGAPCTSKLLV